MAIPNSPPDNPCTSTTYLDEIVAQWANRVFIYSMLLVLITTLFPYDFYFEEMASRFGERFFMANISKPSTVDVVRNIILFLPFGFGLSCVMRKKKLRGIGVPIVILVASTGLSFAVEVLQIFLPSRAPALADILANSIGALLGFLCFQLWGGKILDRASMFVKKSREWLSVKNLMVGFIGYATLWFLITIPLQSVTKQMTKLSNWDQSFTLLLGNEHTGNRPWRGHIFELSIADRAISKEEVAHAFSNTSLPASIEKSLLVSYKLSGKGTYHDQTGHLPDLSWRGIRSDIQEGRGVFLTSNRWLETETPATVLTQRIGKASQFTLIATVATANPMQGGPARIVSLSRDPEQCNFTLGQGETDLVFRLRTPLTGKNGTNPALIVPNIFADTNSHQLIVTYDGTTLQLYVDGLLHRPSLELSPTPGVILSMYLLPLSAYEMKGYLILYYGLIFMPLGFLLALATTLIRRGLIFHILLIGTGAFLPSLILEGILASVSERVINLANLLITMAITFISMLLFKMQVIFSVK